MRQILPQAYSRSVKAKARHAFRRRRPAQVVMAAGAAARCLISVAGPAAAGRAGSSGCAQFDATTIRFISARRSTKSPARLRPCFQRKRPASSSDTGAKNVTQGGMSRTPSPILERPRENSPACCASSRRTRPASRQASNRRPEDHARRWYPRSATANTRPMSDRITRPFEIAALHCTLTVSAQLIRSDVSSSRQPISDTLARPESSMIRSASPRRRRNVVYQPGGTCSRWMTASGAIGAPSSAVGSGRPFGVSSCPAARSSS